MSEEDYFQNIVGLRNCSEFCDTEDDEMPSILNLGLTLGRGE